MCSSQNNEGVGGKGRDSGWPFIFVDDSYLTRVEILDGHSFLLMILT